MQICQGHLENGKHFFRDYFLHRSYLNESSIEIYQIAYLINCKFNSKFIKSKRDIILSKEEAVFDKYEWEKTEKENIWFLFSNKFMIQKKTYENNLLFNSTNILQLFLINEHKNVDFFIRKNKDELTIPVINSINLIFV